VKNINDIESGEKEQQQQQLEQEDEDTVLSKKIKIQFVDIVAEIEYIPGVCSISVQDVRSAAKLTGNQIFIKIVGLKNQKDEKDVHLFKRDKDGLKKICADSTLSNSDIYDVTYEDKRSDYTNKLSKSQLADIRKRFDKIDTDQSKYIDFDEAMAYFDKKEGENLQAHLDFWEDAIIQTPSKKQHFMLKIQESKELKEAMVRSHMYCLKDSDVNNDQKLSFDEFLAHEAALLLADD